MGRTCGAHAATIAGSAQGCSLQAPNSGNVCAGDSRDDGGSGSAVLFVEVFVAIAAVPGSDDVSRGDNSARAEQSGEGFVEGGDEVP